MITGDGAPPGANGGGAEPPADGGRQQQRLDLLGRLEEQWNLPAWLVTQGFHLSDAQPDAGRLAFEDRQGETLLLRMDLAAQRWSCQTAGEPTDRGTAGALLMRRERIGLDECVDRIAACVDLSSRQREPVAYRQAGADLLLCRAVDRHVAALTVEREAEKDLEHLGVTPGTFDAWRFGPASSVLRDPYELGRSRHRAADRAIVVIERPIDAVAYERVHGHQRCAYVYVGDNPTDETKRQLAQVIAGAPADLRIVSAVGRDRRGAALSNRIVELSGRRVVERRGPDYGSRWADQMQIEQRHHHSVEKLRPPPGDPKRAPAPSRDEPGPRSSAPSARAPDPIVDELRGQMARALASGVGESAVRTAIVRRPVRGRHERDR